MALGSYGYTNMVNGSEPPPMRLCYSYYAAGGIENNTYIFNPVVQQGRWETIYILIHKENDNDYYKGLN